MFRVKINRNADRRTYYINFARKNRKGAYTFWKFSHKVNCAKSFDAKDAISMRDALVKKYNFEILIEAINHG